MAGCVHTLAGDDTGDGAIGVDTPLLVLVGGVFVAGVASEEPVQGRAGKVSEE